MNEPQVICVNLADLKDPHDPLGRSFRQVNAARTHAFPIGALVEMDTGERLFVKEHTRDCDQTPLYTLGMRGEDPSEYADLNRGICEIGMTLVRLPE